jgi:hypothetical protein
MAVGEGEPDTGRATDHVAVGQDQAVAGDDHARADAAGLVAASVSRSNCTIARPTRFTTEITPRE